MAQKSLFSLKCPSCSSADTLRNSRPRSSKERFIRYVTFFEIYRCKKCGWRGWRMALLLDEGTLKKILFYLLLMVLAAFIVLNILKLVV